MKPKRKYNRQMRFRFSEEQFEVFNQAVKNTLCRTRSEYARKLLLGKPVTVLYRNRSLDDFIEAAVGIREELKIVLARDVFTQVEKEAFNTAMDHIMKELLKIIEQCSQN